MLAQGKTELGKPDCLGGAGEMQRLSEGIEKRQAHLSTHSNQNQNNALTPSLIASISTVSF